MIARPALRPEAERLIRRLRDAGLRVDALASDRSMKAQFRAADRRDAAHVVIVGDEWERGEVTVKDLQTGQEAAVPVSDLAARLETR